MATQPLDSTDKLLGAGRSGQVFLVNTSEGCVARKIFFEDKLANLVHYLFFGTPNPYIWNPDLIHCAYYRRKILGYLVQFWFDSKLKIADAINLEWNEKFKAYQLDTKFIKGRAVALHQPFKRDSSKELHELTHCVMKPLQKHLIKAGFDGLVWQAGKGNPVALNNFLLESATEEGCIFVCIDVESGVPALFPLNILTLLSFYLPKSFQHGNALFDDVNVGRLKDYVNTHQEALENKLNSKKYTQIIEYINQLEYHQKKWKLLNRVNRSIQYQLRKDFISEEQANWYTEHPARWYLREIGRILRKVLKKLAITFPKKILSKLLTFPYILTLQRVFRFIYSQRYRLKVTRDYVGRRIEKWHHRKQINDEEANLLSTELERDSASDYLNDFAVHLGIKVVTKFIELSIPILFAIGLLDEVVAITWFLIGGPIYRSIYTLYRMLQAAREGKALPWVALLVGLLPTIGDIAYPCQIIYLAGGRRGKVARFIVYDFFTRLGEKIPIWGGEDTLTEHFFNQCAHRLIRSVEWLERQV
jgi:hypothetical protein